MLTHVSIQFGAQLSLSAAESGKVGYMSNQLAIWSNCKEVAPNLTMSRCGGNNVVTTWLFIWRHQPPLLASLVVKF